MADLIVFLGFITCVSTAPMNQFYHSAGNRLIDPPSSAYDVLQRDKNKFKVNTRRHLRDQRIFRLSSPSKIKIRPPNLKSDANFHRVQQYSICNTNSEGNSKMSNSGNTYSGSKAYTFSEKGNDFQKLVCKTKAFRIVEENGVIRRVAVDGSSVLSNDRNSLNMLNNKHQINPNTIEVGSVGHSSMSDLAARKDAVSAINTEAKNARASISSKSRKTPGFLETVSSAEGKTILNDESKGLKTRGKEETRLSTNPRYSVRGPSGRSSGYSLTRLSHNKQTDFELEI